MGKSGRLSSLPHGVAVTMSIWRPLFSELRLAPVPDCLDCEVPVAKKVGVLPDGCRKHFILRRLSDEAIVGEVIPIRVRVVRIRSATCREEGLAIDGQKHGDRASGVVVTIAPVLTSF